MNNVLGSGNLESLVGVLVVDDHPNTARTYARAISQLGGGINVISATSGTQALEYARDNTIDVLITDMMMPDMNGLELIERLQTHPAGRSLHTILITAYDVPGLRETARRLKVKETIIKPVPTERICRIVSNVIDNLKQAKIPAMAENSHRFKIMIADDLPDNVTLLSRYTKSEGYDYVTAANGVEVLAKARTEMPDLILLDVNMPEKDGFAVLEELRADPAIKHIPVIILTAARPNPGDIQYGLSLGADDYMTKPFDKRELFARIRTKLRAKEADDQMRRRNRELSILPEIARELSARPDINELLEVALRRSVETLGAMVGHIIMFNPKGPLHKEYRICTTEAKHSDVQLPPLNDLLQQVRESRESLLIENTRNSPLWKSLADEPSHSVIVAPMAGRFDLLGLFLLIHEQSGYFNLEHQMLLQAIASQASIAVENSRLYAESKKEEQKLAAILHNAADAILTFDADGCLSLLNPAAERLFTGCQTKLGLPLARNCGYDALIESLEEVLASGKPNIQEVSWPDQRVFSAMFTPIDEGGCVILLHDVSQFKALERVKNEFIATASHDLKNPITAIAGFSQLLPVAGPLTAQQQEFVQRISFAAENMKELVENMLDLAKLDAGIELKCEVVDMNDLVAEIAHEFEPQAKAKGQTLNFKASASTPEVHGDPFQLKQALRNLVGNAIKYTPTDGAVSLAVDAEQDAISVHIKDNGYGIPADDLPHIFDRFYRVREGATNDIKGNGLGLAIVKSVIEAHGGQVTVESELSEGSTFSIWLPSQQSPESLATSGE
ncbi:MAG TPA: response regulator [Anaerolineales bacterium]|nr:response regulator [Anaerolineales bacterium]